MRDQDHKCTSISGLKFLKLLFFFRQWNRAVVVKSLRHELQCEGILLSGRLFYFGPLVLEPNLNLCFVESQLGTQLLSPFLSQISIFVELVLQKEKGIEREKGHSLRVPQQKEDDLYKPWVAPVGVLKMLSEAAFRLLISSSSRTEAFLVVLLLDLKQFKVKFMCQSVNISESVIKSDFPLLGVAKSRPKLSRLNIGCNWRNH